MSDERPARNRNLTRRQFDEVMRRATELAARESESGEVDLPEGEVFRIAREVGLPEKHVRQALREVQASSPHDGGVWDRVLGPAVIHASRVVPGMPEELSSRIDDFMVAGRLLQRVRRSGGFLQYRPAVDWISKLARAASATSQKYFVASAHSVEVRLEAVDEDHTLVELIVDPGIRGDYVAGLTLGGGAGALGAGVGAGFGVAVLAPVVLAVAAGGVAAVAVGVVSARLIGRAHRRKAVAVHGEMEGILDRLETGESLDPPPSSWRKWVERQFHGARRLLDPLDDG